MMGTFERPVLRLKFVGTDYDGLEVVTWRLSVADVFEMSKLREATAGNAMAAFARAPEVLKIMSGRLVEWNLTAKGEPVPITEESLWREDAAMVAAILTKMIGPLDVAPPLSQPSNGGGPFPEASIPMEALSPSPPN